MSRIKRGSLEFVFSELYFQGSILFGNNVEFTNHIIVINQMFRVNVDRENLFTALSASYTLLEGIFAICLPFIL